MERQRFSAVLNCLSCSVFQSAAAGNLHTYHSDILNVIVAENPCQLFGIVDIVQLGASD